MYSNHMFILGQGITTPIGTAHPVYIEDYERFNPLVVTLTMDKGQVVALLEQIVAESKNLEPFLEVAKEMEFFDFIKMFSQEPYQDTFLADLYKSQRELFEFIFKEDVIDKIESAEDFEYYRGLIIAMNDVSYKPPNPNPEIARLDRLKEKLQKMKGDTITFEAMYTSILLSGNVAPNDLTLYQFNKVFDRISHYKNHETSTLFKTIDTEGKMKVHPWYATTIEEKEGTITQEQLDNARKLKEKGGLASEL